MSKITIRPPEPGDAGPIAEAVQESLADLAPWLPFATPEYDEASASTWIDSEIRAREAGTGFVFVVVDTTTGRVLGTCGINQLNPIHRFANLGYWVRSSEAGKGIAARAVAEVSRWAFSNTDIERLEILVAIGNTRSDRVAEKAGAVREGVLRSRLLSRGAFLDATLYSLIRPAADL